MSKKTYKVTLEVVVELEVGDEVLRDAQSQEFRDVFYDFTDDRDVVEFLAYQVAANDARQLNDIEGFLGSDDRLMRVKGIDWDYAEYEEVK